MSTAGQSSGALPPDQINALRAQETRLPWMMSIFVILHTVALVTCTLRVYVRAVMIKQFGIDDGLMVAAAVCPTTPLPHFPNSPLTVDNHRY